MPDRAGIPTLGTHRSTVGEIGGDVLRQLVFDLVLLFVGSSRDNSAFMATVIFQATAAGDSFTADEGEEIRLRHRAQLYIGETLDSTGDFIISTRCARACGLCARSLLVSVARKNTCQLTPLLC